MKKLLLKIGEIVQVNGIKFRVHSFTEKLLQLSIIERDFVMEKYDNKEVSDGRHK